MLPEPIAVTAKVTSVLEKLNVPYFIGGSLASTIYGMVRTTQDSDIVAELHPSQVQAFVDALKDTFYVDDEMIAEAVNRSSSFNIIHRETMFKVDVFIPRMIPFDESRFSRAQMQTLSNDPEVKANVSSVEDTILMKLVWYRMGGEVSERQWRDVMGMIKIQSERLDLKYMKQWAIQLKVGDLLDRALKEA
jgi:hypothetical protein